MRLKIFQMYFLVSLAAAPLIWSPVVLAGEAGLAGASFLKFSAGPRGAGMGEANTSVSEDAYCAWWNPAGLGGVERLETAASYNASFSGVSHQYLSAVYPARYGSGFGFNITRLAVGTFQGYDAQGARTGGIDASDLALGVAYGRALIKDEVERPVLNVGAGIKVINESLAGVSSNGAALDLGALYYIRPDKYWLSKAPAQEFRLGLAVRNIGPGLKFDSRSAPLPLAVALGASWHSFPGGTSRLILSLDQTVANDENYYAALGAEYEAFQLFSVRAGWRSGQDIGSGIRFGLGFRLSAVDIDYAMAPFGELGAMHRFGVTMRFGRNSAVTVKAGATPRVEKGRLIAPKENIEKLRYLAGEFLELSTKALAARDYSGAAQNLDKAFNLDPSLEKGEWGTRRTRLAAVTAALKLNERPERGVALAESGRQAADAAEAINAYLEGREFKAFLLAHAALGDNSRGDPVFEDLLYALGRLTGMQVRKEEILPRTALMGEKLEKAAGFFYERKFDAAAKECEEASLLDPANPWVWSRLGSAYFMMGDKAAAEKAYRKAMDLNPGDEVTKKFMETQGWR